MRNDSYSFFSVRLRLFLLPVLFLLLLMGLLLSGSPAYAIEANGGEVTDGASFVGALGGQASFTTDGDLCTVTLQGDAELPDVILISAGNYVLEGSGTISRAPGYTKTVFQINDGSSLTIGGNVIVDGGAIWTKDGAYASPADGGANSGIVATASMIQNSGTFTLTGNAVLQNNAAEFSNNHNTRAVYTTGMVYISGGVIRDCSAS
ncbi:MAG: hypothetical protein IJM69_08015, partial [Firmicutes bacterium]|nr:hypothetical protein [Bacillota bacterium]